MVLPAPAGNSTAAAAPEALAALPAAACKTSCSATCKTACPAPAKQPSIMLIQPDTGWDLQLLYVTMTILILAW